jgi:hypothetical protein
MCKGFRCFVVGLIVTGAAVRSYAQGNSEVDWFAAGFTYLTLQNGTYVPTGCLLEIGKFTSAPVAGSPSLQNFVPFATGSMGQGLGVDGAWAIGSTADSTGFVNQQIYLVAFNAPTAGAATELGIFCVDDAVNSGWKFQSSAAPPTTIELQDLVQNAGTPANSLSPGAQVIFGSGPFYDAAEGVSYLTLGVPEPSTFALVGVSCLSAVGLMRRRRA